MEQVEYGLTMLTVLVQKGVSPCVHTLDGEWSVRIVLTVEKLEWFVEVWEFD